MKIDNRLTQQFLHSHPKDAARVLEQVPVADVIAFLDQLSIETVTPVLNAMLPARASNVIDGLEIKHAAKLLIAMAINRATRVYYSFDVQKRKTLQEHLPIKFRARMRQIRNYAPLTAGDLMNNQFHILPYNLSVADALRRIERNPYSGSCEIYAVDDALRLLGVLELSSLLAAQHHDKLRDIMNRSVESVSAHTRLENLVNHPAWGKQHSLPVVDKDNSLIGILHYGRLKELRGKETDTRQDPVETLLTITNLYWITMVELLGSVFSMRGGRRGERP